MFGKKEDIDKEIQKVEGEAISSIIDKSMIVTGEIHFKGKTRIDGTVNGNVHGEHLLLSKDGRINGDLTVSSFVCQGLLIGNIDAKILTAKKGSNIRGKIIAVNLTVEPGASLDGQIKAAAQDSSATATAAVEGKGPGDKAGDSHKNNKS
jgi:cytoskeletal protein CcmA (bactofilin family)